MPWKPDDYPSLSPYLMVRDAEATMRFAEAAFDATRLRVHPREDGKGIMHAELRIDDSVVMMGEVPGGPDAHLHLYVPDAPATFASALAAGGTEVQPLTEKGDGDNRGGVADGQGTTWWISQQIGD
ncbi:MAG: VOC family protein [Sulfitobacter sp.]|nr:VOC family protein [Sulfitobacter sp.]